MAAETGGSLPPHVQRQLKPGTSFKDANGGGPENLGDVLGRLFVTRGWGRVSERTQLENAWRQAATEQFAAVTRVAGLRRGILEVEGKNAVVIQELAHFHKKRILAALRALLPKQKITDVKFRAGGW
jgi:predicted nucleic acid-binding Zn ribbon protein